MRTGFFKALAGVLFVGASSAQANDDLTFGLTTTQEASGIARALLDDLKSTFPDYQLSYSVSGSSQLLRSLQEGFIPFGITHNIPKEQELVSLGHHSRTPLFANDFLFVGPKDSEIKCDEIVDCLRELLNSEAVFLSRGDQSGTHAFELQKWAEAGIDPILMKNYQVASGGAANSLRICGIRKCHLIVDESSFAASSNNQLVELARDRGTNVYSLIHSHQFSHGRGSDILSWMVREVPKISETFGYRAQ